MSAKKGRPIVPHYCYGELEVIDILKDKMSAEEFRGFCRGNVFKYLFRYPHAGRAAVDLQKASTYLSWLREEVESEKGKSK